MLRCSHPSDPTVNKQAWVETGLDKDKNCSDSSCDLAFVFTPKQWIPSYSPLQSLCTWGSYFHGNSKCLCGGGVSRCCRHMLLNTMWHFSVTETKPHCFSSLVRHASVVGGITQEIKIAESFTLWLVIEWDLVCITIIEGALFQVSAAQSSLESNLQL